MWTGRRADGLSEDELIAASGAGYEAGGDGCFIGRDPRLMPQAALEAIGHEPISPMQAIRAKCLDCCAGSSDEVRNVPRWRAHPGRSAPAKTPGARRCRRNSAKHDGKERCKAGWDLAGKHGLLHRPPRRCLRYAMTVFSIGRSSRIQVLGSSVT